MSFGHGKYVEECIGEFVLVYFVGFNFTQYDFAEQAFHIFYFCAGSIKFFNKGLAHFSNIPLMSIYNNTTNRYYGKAV